MSVVVRDAERGSLLMPETSYRLDLKIVTKKGETLSLSGGDFLPSDVKFTCTGIDCPGGAFEISREVARKDLNREYEFVAQYGHDAKKLRTATVKLRIDEAQAFGPPPADIADIVVSDLPVQGVIRPGYIGSFKLQIRQKSGQVHELPTRFESGYRLNVATHGVTFNPENRSLVFAAERSTLGGRQYRLELSYADRPDLIQTFVWDPDWKALEGPDAKEVSAMSIRLVGIRGDKVPPGYNGSIIYSAAAKDGRTYTSEPGAMLRLPLERLTVQGQNVQLKNGGAEAVFAAGPKELVGQTFGISVAMRGAGDSQKWDSAWKPDFASLANVNREPLALRIKATNGKSGAPGEQGRHGELGAYSTDEIVPGGPGQPGGDGDAGGDGHEGDAGLELTVDATEVFTLDGSERLIWFRIRAGETVLHQEIVPGRGQEINIASEGGSGGPGGPGGRGGTGGRGGDGLSTGSGGDGGSGGQGGNGGTGGDGGDIRLIASSEDVASRFKLTSLGGAGGSGGAAGEAATGGQPGSSKVAIAQFFAAGLGDALAGRSRRAPRTSVGRQGSNGRSGRSGRRGDPGRQGRVTIEPGNPDQLWNAIPEDVRKNLLQKVPVPTAPSTAPPTTDSELAPASGHASAPTPKPVPEESESGRSEQASSSQTEKSEGALRMVRVSGSVMAAMAKKLVPPSYSASARAARIQGTVRFDAVIGVDGSVRSLTAVSGHPFLIESAMVAARQWVYLPMIVDEKAVEVKTQIDVNFTLSQ